MSKMKLKVSFVIISTLLLHGCTSKNPVQDQVVGGNAFFDALTGTHRIGIIAKQPIYDAIIVKPVLEREKKEPVGFEICAQPPADAMNAISSALSASIDTKEDVASLKASSAYLSSSAAFSFRSQGLSYMRDAKFNNCLLLMNIASDARPPSLYKKIIEQNEAIDIRGAKMIAAELEARAKNSSAFKPSTVSLDDASIKALADLIEKTKPKE